MPATAGVWLGGLLHARGTWAVRGFIARLMEERKVKKAELARRLGKSRAYVTQMLSGSANLTVRTLAEVAYALGVEVKLEAVPLEAARPEAESPRAV